MKTIKTNYIPLHKYRRHTNSGPAFGPVVHVATITSSWKPSDFDALARNFPGTIVATSRQSCGVNYLRDCWKDLFLPKFI